jgi:hypothetical protein
MTLRPIAPATGCSLVTISPPDLFTAQDATMRFLLCCGASLAMAAVAPAQTAAPAASYVHGYRQLAASLDRCQDALSRIGALERSLGDCGPRPAPYAIRPIIHELAGEIAVLRSECGQLRPAIGLGCQALQRASETLARKAAESNSAAGWMTEDVIKQQYLSLSRHYGAANETMSNLCKEWEVTAKRLDRCATFLAHAGSAALEWETLAEVMPVVAPDESSPTVSQAKTIARAVAERFDLVPALKKDLPQLKAALTVLGYSVSEALGVTTPGRRATPPARGLNWNRGAAQRQPPASGSAPGIRRSRTIEELRRAGWLTVRPPD